MSQLSWEMLRSAIAEFLQLAYPDGRIPEPVQKRLAFDESKAVVDQLGGPPFERYQAEAPFPCTVHALRLGSAAYPHLKMEIRPFTNHLGFVFWVNTHDQFLSKQEGVRDLELWRELMERNRELKQAVERAWARRGLPTFTTAIQEDSGVTEVRS